MQARNGGSTRLLNEAFAAGAAPVPSPRATQSSSEDVTQSDTAGILVVGIHDDVAQVGKLGVLDLAGDRVREVRQHVVERLEVIDPAEMIG